MDEIKASEIEIDVMLNEFESEEIKNTSISELISFLRSSFKRTDFEKVERMLEFREERMKLQKETFEAQMNRYSQELKAKDVELKKQLEVYRTRCNELEEGSWKTKQEYVSLEGELKDYKRKCDELKEKINLLEKDHKVVCDRESRTHERNTNLEKTNNDVREKYLKLKIENRVRELGKIKAEEELEVWKKRFRELDSQLLLLKDEISVLRCGEPHLEDKVVKEPGDSGIVSLEYKGKTETSQTTIINSEATNGTSSAKLATPQVEGGPSTERPYKQLKISKEKKSSIFYGSQVRKQLVFEQEGCPDKKDDPKGIIDISDSDDEKDINPMLTSSIRGNISASISTDCVLGNEREISLGKCLKRRAYSDCRGEKNEDTCEKNSPSTLVPKKKHPSTMITGYNEGGDNYRSTTDKLEKFQELINGPSGSIGPTIFPEAEEVKKSTISSRKPPLMLIECTEKKGSAERASQNYFEVNRAKFQLPGKSTTKNAKENEPEKFEIDHLEGFSIDGSNDLDSEDSSTDSEGLADGELLHDDVLSRIRYRRNSKSEWEYEADMLASFENSPELCMKAVCALYRQQTTKEKSMKVSLYSNNGGFNKFDALRGTNLAEFLMDGDRQGELKKSVEDLQNFDPKALDECSRLAKHYSTELFEIYRNKEDPFFFSSI